MERGYVVNEAIRVVDRYIVGELDSDIETVVEIIRKGKEVTEMDVEVAVNRVCRMNRYILLLVGGDSELYEAEKYHLFRDSNGWLSLVKGKEIGGEPF